jgi:alpha-L-rhamnosidase
MKTIARILLLALFAVACREKTQVTVVSLKCENKVNPLGIDLESPRLSWNLESAKRGVSQSAYRVMVATSPEKLDQDAPDAWDSQKIPSDQSLHIPYGGKPLESNRKYYWKVDAWDQNGDLHRGPVASWTTGLLKETDWQAKWIGLDKVVGDDNPEAAHRSLSARMLRHEFVLDKRVKSATAFISGLGLFELYLNGRKIGDQVLAPALTEYDKRSFYMTFDVTGNLQPDRNAIGVILGNGRFFAMRAGGTERTKNYGFPKVICQLLIEYEDGTSAVVASDESWKLTANGPIRKNSEYDGEYYDARMELDGWNLPGFNDASWSSAELVEMPGEKLVAQPSEPIRVMDEVNPVAVKEIKPGIFIYDMGQNMVGWLELFVKGKKGDKVSLRFAESLKPDGSLFLDNIRTAEVTDTYILKGEGEEKWEPRFTYHGFRYVEMTGYPGTPGLASVKGKVIHDALEVSGSFKCSNPLINSVYRNAYWGIRGNYRSIPTDCPQRDERQGWLGDRSAECTGESYVFNISNLYAKWVTDIRDAQLESGSLPDVAPSYWPFYTDNTTWPGTFLYANDMLYTQYGDLKVLESNYPAMKRWIGHMSQFLEKGIMPRDMYGDWCVPPENVMHTNSSDPNRITRSDFIGTAYFHNELKLMEKFARLLGQEQDAASYAGTAEEMKAAFNEKFLDKVTARYSNNTCTANILALAFGLVPEEYQGKIVDNLLRKILSENEVHLSTGLIGGQWLMRTLTNAGHGDVAYALAAQDTYPGWGYMVKKGATTIWELWNGEYGDPGMNSGNHVMMLGDLITWYYENLAGIKPDPANPGFRHLLMKPGVWGDLTSVDASFNSAYGPVISQWKLGEEGFSWGITIPANTTATVWVPTRAKEKVREGGNPASGANGVSFKGWEGSFAVLEIRSGSYLFTSEGAAYTKTTPYVSNPVIFPRDTLFAVGSAPTVSITCADPSAVIRYTVDGSVVTDSSSVYTGPVVLTGHTTVRAQAFREGYHPSNQELENYHFVDPARNGIQWKQFNRKVIRLPDLSVLKPVAGGTAYRFSLTKIDVPKHDFILQMTSWIELDKEGDYTFYITSNDGSKLYINDKLFVDNDGEHGAKEMSNTIHLAKGRHKIGVEYFNGGGGKVLSVSYSSADIPYQPLPEYILFTSKEN